MKGGGIVTAEGIALFETAIGLCGIAWSGDLVAAVQLPERSVTGTRQRLLRRHPSAGEQEPPPAIATAIDRLKSALAGEPASLAEVALDLHVVVMTLHRGLVADKGLGNALLESEERRLHHEGAVDPVRPAPRGRSAPHCHAIPSHSSCPATGSSPPAASSAGSRQPAERSPSAACSRSRALDRTPDRTSSTRRRASRRSETSDRVRSAPRTPARLVRTQPTGRARSSPMDSPGNRSGSRGPGCRPTPRH